MRCAARQRCEAPAPQRPRLPTIFRVNSLQIITGYLFVELNDCRSLRLKLLASAQAESLKGTVILAPEGINLQLAGPADALQRWLDGLQVLPAFATLRVRRQTTAQWPFAKLLIKCKTEIIRMNTAGIRPAAGRAPALAPAVLQRWLQRGHCDEGRPLALLDTRNDWEVDAGRFAQAIDWRLARFSDFPQALAEHARELQGKTVVSYCTGGIRCEKAALLMQQLGLPDVYQLQGGILDYFEQTEQAPHWQGRCIVFDERGALAPDESGARA